MWLHNYCCVQFVFWWTRNDEEVGWDFSLFQYSDGFLNIINILIVSSFVYLSSEIYCLLFAFIQHIYFMIYLTPCLSNGRKELIYCLPFMQKVYLFHEKITLPVFFVFFLIRWTKNKWMEWVLALVKKSTFIYPRN